MEAAARADTRSQLWEEGQKSIFVLIKTKHSKMGLNRLAFLLKLPNDHLVV